jgi:8-oxo-dGTP pyrophosphatase MutT (NUDIX family)
MAGRLCVPVDAYMLLERNGKVLMLRRAASARYAAGLLCPPSGHVEAGETVSEAAVRETAEETGIKAPAGSGALCHGGAPPRAGRPGTRRVVLRRRARMGRRAGQPGAG